MERLESRDCIDSIDLDLIKQAFEKGYKLGVSDKKDGIHIKFAEIQSHFVNEFTRARINASIPE